MKKFDEKICSGRSVIGAWQQIDSAVSAEAMCSLGFDWIAVDLEHSRIGGHQAEDTFIVAERYGVVSFARLPEADPFLARKLLDSGADGLIIANVKDAGMFAEFADLCRYPPSGRRGVGLTRSNRWGDRFEEQVAGFEPILVPQIESVEGLSACSEIARVEGVRGLFLGPYDLSASLGRNGDFESEAYLNARQRFLEVCNSELVFAGIHQVEPDTAALNKRVAEGFQFIAYGTDIVAMRASLSLPSDIQSE